MTIELTDAIYYFDYDTYLALQINDIKWKDKNEVPVELALQFLMLSTSPHEVI